MLTIVDYPYYQPQYENGNLPKGLLSNQAFRSEQEAIDWVEKHLDSDAYEGDFEIREYCNDDLQDVELIDRNGDVIPKIESLSDSEIADEITDSILLDMGSIDNMHATRQSDESEDEFKNRVYDEALDMVNDAVSFMEDDNVYDFSSYGGNPDVDWYDEARDIAVRTVMGWMLENYPY